MCTPRTPQLYFINCSPIPHGFVDSFDFRLLIFEMFIFEMFTLTESRKGKMKRKGEGKGREQINFFPTLVPGSWRWKGQKGK